MKRHFWLILAVLSLLGMLILPSTAHSAVIAAPTALPTINAPRMILPNYPVPSMSIRQPQIQLAVPQLTASLVPAVMPSVIAMAPVVLSPIMTAEAPAVIAPGAPRLVSPQSAIPASRIEGISAGRKTSKGVGRVLIRISEMQESGLPSSRKIAAMFDGAAQQEPSAVPVSPVQTAPADSYEDNSLTLPESDLAEEIGLGY